MKTSNTVEEKERFFAQYYGQDVLHYRRGKEHVYGLMEVDMGTFYDESYLELSPLSAITDEHAIEVSKIWYKGGRDDIITRSEANKKRYASDMREQLDFDLNTVTISSNIADYLRSKGYLIPFKDLTPEELISRGWAKYREI